MIQNTTSEMRISAFARLGNIMGLAADSITLNEPALISEYPELYNRLQAASLHNPWFTTNNIAFALNEWESALKEESIRNWLASYEIEHHKSDPEKIAVIMAGNIPIVGFHDFLCVLMSGNSFLGKLSNYDKVLLPALADVLSTIEPSFKASITFTDNTIKEFDKIIATGSNNTARYFEYYFSRFPHIIRKNRNGVAVLSGSESEESIKKLGTDICSYFGLGCRNVSKVFVPEGYDTSKLFSTIEPYYSILNNHYKYMNNYSYQRSLYLLNSTPHLDNGVFMLTESTQYTSPIPVLFYEFYSDPENLKLRLLTDIENIQCIATEVFKSEKTVLPGDTQRPGLSDYADASDTMKFLLNQ